VTLTTWLVRFDEKGACVSPATRTAALAFVAANPDRRVIFFSHGWKTDFDGALEQYGAFLRSFQSVLAAHPLPPPEPIFVGVTWPSRWLATAPGPVMAATSTENDAAEVRQEIARNFPPAVAERFHELADAAALDVAEARELVEMTLRASPATDLTDELGEAQAPAATTLLNAWQTLASGQGGTNDDFDSVGTVSGAGGTVSAAGGGLDPIDFIRLFSLFQMKDRAAVVGARGIAKLLTDLTAVAPGVHVVGHSFGAKVMLSAVLGDAARAKKPRSLLLLQPALSHLAFAESLPDGRGRAGYADVPELLDTPVLSTFSRWDVPLHDIFHLAVVRPEDVGEAKVAAAAGVDEPPNRYAALGGYGPRGAKGQRLVTIPAPGTTVVFNPEDRVLGLDGGGPGKPIDGHMGVANAYTGWALREQMKA
jgi:hypothetical protein